MILTEDVALSRARAKDLAEVKSLNMWGQDITDASVLLKMPSVEVLSLSVNQISTLSCFRKCLSLKELYLRKNSIRDISEIQYLAQIESLRVLWLSDNPCADCKEYRSTVVSYLPKLQKLDNVDITDEERESAREHALRLHALDVPDTPIKDYGVAPAVGGLPRDASGLDAMDPAGASPLIQARKSSLADASGYGTSSNILYAVIALLQELDQDSLRIVRAEVDSILQAPPP